MKTKACGCPGAHTIDFREKGETQNEVKGAIGSELRQWPVQMHLISPEAPYFKGADVVLSADCVAYSFGDFHRKYLKGKAVGIACPKLDGDQEIYLDKIKSWIDDAKINTLTVLIMQVPCCMGLLELAKEAAGRAKRKIPIKYCVVGLQGEILQEEWA